MGERCQSRDDVNWTKVEAQFRAGLSSRKIGEEHDVTHQAILQRAQREGWQSGKRNWRDEAEKTKTAELIANPATVSDRRIVGFGKRTPETMARILTHIEKHGASYRLAAQAVGIRPNTLQVWREEDPDFVALIEAARAAHLVGQTSNIAKAGNRGQWQASARILEAAAETKEDWGQKVGAGGGSVTINFRFTRDQPIIDVTPE